MPSSSSQQPSVTAKPRGIFLRKKMADFGFSSASKISVPKLGCKNRSSENVNGDAIGNNVKSNSPALNPAEAPVAATITESVSTADLKRNFINNSCFKTRGTNSSNTKDSNNKDSQSNCNNSISTDSSSSSSISNISNNSDSKNSNTALSDENSGISSESLHQSQMISNHNGSFTSTSRITNESSNSAVSSDEAATSYVTSSSSSSSHQRLHRQITRTSEMKTSCMKSNLTELKSSMSEMKNLSFNNSKLKKSLENLLDDEAPVPVTATTSTTTDEGNCTATSSEPLITYPESPTPNSSTSIVTFPTEQGTISRKSSIVTIDGSGSSTPSTTAASELKFEQRHLSAASKTKLITEQFKSEESLRNEMECKRLQSCDQFAAYEEQFANRTLQTNLQTNNVLCGKSLDARHEERTVTSGDLTQQQSQNICSAKVRLQSDSFSTEKVQKAVTAQQQRQTSVTSSVGGMFNKEKHITHHSNYSTSKGFSTSVSHMQQFSNNSTSGNFIKNEVEDSILFSRQSSIADYLSESFDDLHKLRENANQQNVEKAINKYSANLQHIMQSLNDAKFKSSYNMPAILNKISEMMGTAWLIPTHGHQLGNSLCNVLRDCGGLDFLIANCDSTDDTVQFSSAKLLEQCLTTENRAYVVDHGLEKVVNVACAYTKSGTSSDHSRISTGILEHLFKHSEGTCEDVIRLGGLDAVLFECRKNDVETLRHCASALANLSLYGGADNQEAMIKRKVPVWLFPLAFHNDDNIKYYACLAIAVLVANKEIEAAVLKSGTLDLVEPFVTSHNPSEFARSNLSHAHGQSKTWLQRLVPVLSSKREEARNLAAFHFCMEAGIKKSQENTEVFRDIGAIECLKKVASCPNAIASKFAAQALRLIGEDVPHKLSQQVPLWSVEDVKEWVIQIGFAEYVNNFVESRVDGDLLLQLNEENLKNDIGIVNGIRRRRFTRELQSLKKMADYSSRDTANLNAFLQTIGCEFTVYTYSMLNAGVDKESIKCLSQDQLLNECGIVNSIHRLRILESIKAGNCFTDTFQNDSEKPLDVFISYRRSNGSQLASLLKVHLQVRNFTVFIDVEKLEAGKFDNNLLQSIKQARNFLLVLTPNSLDRCLGDVECKDWVHREIVAALQSHCNIIPIIDNFQWPEPEELPEDMRAICHFNGIRWIHDYQDACVEKLERFMKGEVSNKSVYTDLMSVPHGYRFMKTDLSSLIKSPPSFERTHSNDSNKGSDGSCLD